MIIFTGIVQKKGHKMVVVVSISQYSTAVLTVLEFYILTVALWHVFVTVADTVMCVCDTVTCVYDTVADTAMCVCDTVADTVACVCDCC